MSELIIAEDAADNLPGLYAGLHLTPPQGDAPATDEQPDPTVMRVFLSEDGQSAYLRFEGPRARDLGKAAKKQNLAHGCHQILFWAAERFDEASTRALVRSLGLMLDHHAYEREETEKALRGLGASSAPSIAALVDAALRERGLSPLASSPAGASTTKATGPR